MYAYYIHITCDRDITYNVALGSLECIKLYTPLFHIHNKLYITYNMIIYSYDVYF